MGITTLPFSIAMNSFNRLQNSLSRTLLGGNRIASSVNAGKFLTGEATPGRQRRILTSATIIINGQPAPIDTESLYAYCGGGNVGEDGLVCGD